MRGLLLGGLLLFGAVPSRAAEAKAHHELDAMSLQVVDYVLRSDIPNPDPKLVSYFLTLDMDAVPKAKRKKAKAKKLAIETALKLRRLSHERTVPAGAAYCKPKYYPASYIPILRLVGYGEITDLDEQYLEKRTRCSETDLMCQFSLAIVVIPRKNSLPKRRFFLHKKDPLNAFVAEYRGGIKAATNFFGAGAYTCSR